MMAMMINQRVLLSNRLQKQLFIIVPPKISEEARFLPFCYHIMTKREKGATKLSISVASFCFFRSNPGGCPKWGWEGWKMSQKYVKCAQKNQKGIDNRGLMCYNVIIHIYIARVYARVGHTRARRILCISFP